jgi:hypothetical protein
VFTQRLQALSAPVRKVKTIKVAEGTPAVILSAASALQLLLFRCHLLRGIRREVAGVENHRVVGRPVLVRRRRDEVPCAPYTSGHNGNGLYGRPLGWEILAQ